MLRVVIHFFRGDARQMADLLRWALELNPEGVRYNCLLSYESGTDPEEVSNIWSVAKKYFKGVIEEHQYPPPKSSTWPEAPNWAWARTATFINQIVDKQPWLWLESDAIPLVSGWLDKIEAEYFKGGLPFMGHIVKRPSRKPGEEYDFHMNGVAVLPHDACLHSSRAMSPRAAPWDVVLSEECIGRMHKANDLIQHIQRYTGVLCTCRDGAVLDHMISQGTALFHGSNDGSVISFLRGKDPEPPSLGEVVKVVELKDLDGVFDECESIWQQEAVELKRLGQPCASFEYCTERKVPSFRDQTAWNTGVFHQLEYGKNTVHLNPALVKDDAGMAWLVTRRWDRWSSVSAYRTSWHSDLVATPISLDTKQADIGKSVVLDFRTAPMVEHEDPRVVFHSGYFHVSYCTWERQLRQAHGKQGLAVFDKNWKLVSDDIPPYGKNKDKANDYESEDEALKPKWEKNWVWFLREEEWYLLYSFSPFRIYRRGRYIAEPAGQDTEDVEIRNYQGRNSTGVSRWPLLDILPFISSMERQAEAVLHGGVCIQ